LRLAIGIDFAFGAFFEELGTRLDAWFLFLATPPTLAVRIFCAVETALEGVLLACGSAHGTTVLAIAGLGHVRVALIAIIFPHHALALGAVTSGARSIPPTFTTLLD
jgi:hypothetical protein